VNGTHQLLLYADDVYSLDENIKTAKTQKLLETSKEFGVEMKSEKTKYMLMFLHLSSGRIITKRGKS